MALFKKTTSGKLHIDIDGFIEDLGHGATHTRTAETTDAMTKLLADIESEAAKLKAEEKAAIKGALPEIEALGGNKDKVKAFTEALNYATTGKSVEAIKADLITNPLARKFLSAEDLTKAGFSTEASTTLDNLIKSKEKLTGLLKDNGDKAKEIEAIFIEHHGSSKEVTTALIGGESKLSAAATKIDAAVTSDLVKIKRLHGEYETAKLAVSEAAGAKGTSAEALKVLENTKTEAADAIKKATNEVHSSASIRALEKSDKAIYESLKSDKLLGSHIESTYKSASSAANAGKDGAKLLKGGKWYSFIHDAESAGTEVAKVGKFRWGKAGIVAGAAAITAVIISAIGGKGPGENADKVRTGRDNEPVARGA